MSQDMQETFLSTLADDLAASLFDGAGSSSNVITPTDTDPSKEEAGTPDPAKVAVKHKSFSNPVDDVSTDELIGDLLKDDDKVESTPAVEATAQQLPPKATKKDKKNTELGFDIGDLYKEGLISPYEDEAPITNVDEFKALLKANREELVEETKEEALKLYKDSLPEQAKILLEYAEKGGEEFSRLIKYLNQDQTVKEINLESPEDQKEIIRQYYASQEWTPEEIRDEIEDLLDSGEEKLKERASRLKPKLDAMNQKQIEAQLKEADMLEQRRQEAREFYVSNVVDTLKKGKLGSLPITKDEQADIYKALIEERYNSLSGTTNRLGALLDEIQYIKPNYELLGKVMLMLSDPEGYDKKILDRVKQEVTADTVKKLKSQQGLKKTGAGLETRGSGNKLPRLNSNFKNPFQD
jgi:hypothetical protein